MATGVMPEPGLCINFKNDTNLKLFEPVGEYGDYIGMLWGHWCVTLSEANKIKSYRTKFNKLRQTIVLFMAAMNGEI